MGKVKSRKKTKMSFRKLRRLTIYIPSPPRALAFFSDGVEDRQHPLQHKRLWSQEFT